MRNKYIIDTLTLIDIQEIVKTGGKVNQNYEGVICREIFKISPIRKIIEKLFALRQKNKDEIDDLMQNLVKLIRNSVYGVQIRKDIHHFYKGKPEHWMQTENDEDVLDYWKLPNGIYVVKMENDDGLDDNINVKITLPSRLGSFFK